MKIKVLSRNDREFVSEKGGIPRIQRSFDPLLHPFEKPREYTRALQAAKLEKVFAKPFVGSLSGHRDGVYCMTRHPRSVGFIASGATDGEIKIWDLSALKSFHSIAGAHTVANLLLFLCFLCFFIFLLRSLFTHSLLPSVPSKKGFVRGLAIPVDASYLFSCGDDKTVKLWDLNSWDNAPVSSYNTTSSSSKGKEVDITEGRKEAFATFVSKEAFTGLDHQYGWHAKLFATSAGSCVEIWDRSRSDPINKLEFGVDSVTSVRFNPIEIDILASTTVERAIALYDLRGGIAIRKLVMTHRANSITWNPMEAFNFTVASEDHHCYTFDMRKVGRRSSPLILLHFFAHSLSLCAILALLSSLPNILFLLF
jgi:WD repeat and SOF domain-containing protein 1